MADDAPAVYDHYRLTAGDTDARDGPVFRVVGVDNEHVTLLRLTDDRGNREATGDLRHVSHERLDRAFEPASNPDPQFELPDYLAGLLVLAGVALAVHPAGDHLSVPSSWSVVPTSSGIATECLRSVLLTALPRTHPVSTLVVDVPATPIRGPVSLPLYC